MTPTPQAPVGDSQMPSSEPMTPPAPADPNPGMGDTTPTPPAAPTPPQDMPSSEPMTPPAPADPMTPPAPAEGGMTPPMGGVTDAPHTEETPQTN